MLDDVKSRRKFLGEMLGICVAGPALLKGIAQEVIQEDKIFPVRVRLKNPYTENGKPVVVIVKGTEYAKMLTAGMGILGGFSKFGTNKSVIIKPNFVFDKRTRYPTTTDENSVLTTVEFLQKEGFTNITVADRRANRKNGRAGGKFEWSGLNDKAGSGGFKTDSLMDNALAETVVVKNEKWKNMSDIGVIKKIYDSDLIINMPTLKRHSITNLTCSLKNMMGVLDVPTTEYMHLWGDANKKIHDTMSGDERTRRLCLTIAEAAMAVNPEMTIIDARQVLCKDHLSVQTGESRVANRLIISGDSVAADICAARLLKEIYEPYNLGFTKDTFEYAASLGLGTDDPAAFILKEINA